MTVPQPFQNEGRQRAPDWLRRLKDLRSFHSVGAGLMAGRTTQKSSSPSVWSLQAQFNQATPFGKYDAALVEAVEKKRDDLLTSPAFKPGRTGKVDVYFHLNLDGTVSDLKITKNTAGELLGRVCQEAIMQSAPFAPWPPDMLRMVGQQYREITFTFYYH